MEENKMARSLNEWMRRYIGNPEEFEAEFNTVIKYLKEKDGGKTPSYGDVSVAYMIELDAALTLGDK